MGDKPPLPSRQYVPVKLTPDSEGKLVRNALPISAPPQQPPGRTPVTPASPASPATDALPKQISAVYKRLATTATTLNSASDELGRSISALDTALKKLNLGIVSWVRTGGWDEPGGEYQLRQLGYARVSRTWGIALRTLTGHEAYPNETSEEIWLFNDAPRALRIEAVEKLPELFEKLIEDADAATMSIRAKSNLAKELAVAINDVASELGSRRK